VFEKRQMKPKITKLQNTVNKDGVDPLGSQINFIMKDRVKNIDIQRDSNKNPNNE